MATSAKTTPAAPQRHALSPRHLSSSAVLLLLGGSIALIAGSLPVLLVPIQQDDLSFLLADNANSPSFLRVLDSSFAQLTMLGRTNFASAAGAGLHHYLIWHIGTGLGVPLPFVERGLFLIWLFAAIVAGAIFAAIAFDRPAHISKRELFAGPFFVIAVVVGGTLQIHSRWSNDPAVSYPAWGFGSATLAFLYLAAVFHTLKIPGFTLRRGIVLLSLGALTLFWYEMNWVLPIVASVICAVFVRGADRKERRRAAAGWLALVAAPSVLLVGVRAYLLNNATATYSGIEPHLGMDSLVAFARGVAGSLPGAAWPLSVVQTYRAGQLAIDWRSLLSAVVILMVVALSFPALKRLPRGDDNGPSSPHPIRQQSWWLPVGSLILYGLGCVAIFAITTKYAQEIYRLGTVYSFYAPATIVLGTVTFAMILVGRELRITRSIAFAIMSAAISLVLVQSVLNWSLLDLQRVDMATAVRLVEMPIESTTEAERCKATREFNATEFPFYAYPDDWILDNLNILQKRATGELWCATP